MNPEQHASKVPELYLVLQMAPGSSQAGDILHAAAKDAAPAAVLLRPPSGMHLRAPDAKALIDLGQKLGIAMLLADEPEMARALKADGIHLRSGSDVVQRYRVAREHLGSHAIIGADAGCSRHDAMELGEAGASYISFGVLPGGAGSASGTDHRTELISWWSEIFEVPCVAFDVASVADVIAMFDAGADFVALSLPEPSTPATVTAFLQTMRKTLFPVEANS